MKLSKFKGLNTTADQIRLAMGWLSVADNVNITNTGAIEARQGFARVLTGTVTGAYSTEDFQRMYLVDGGNLKTFDGAVLKTGLTSLPMYWTEINGDVYFNNGTDSGVIHPDHGVDEWRGASLANAYGAGFVSDDGQNLDVLYDTLPTDTTVIQAWRGRIYAVQYLPSEDTSVIWFSEPLAFHLFNLDSNYITVPGQARMLARTKSALVIGTQKGIHAYDGDRIEQLADYGVPPGWHDALDGDSVTFWSLRGLCTAMPFNNITEGHISVAPGTQAGGVLVQSGGQKRYVVALRQGGSAFNSYS